MHKDDPRFVVSLSVEDRAALEKVRGDLGLRSQADAVRALIRSAAEVPIQRGREQPVEKPAPEAPQPVSSPKTRVRTKTTASGAQKMPPARTAEKFQPISALGEAFEPKKAQPKGAKR